ncbi:peptidoglycan-binding domain-containing protein [Bartonella sp. B41]
MAKRRKIHKKKVMKKRIQRSIIITFFLISSRFLFWIAKKIYYYACKNTLLIIGLFIFTISFVLILFNALFSQMTEHQGVFTQIELKSISNTAKNSAFYAKKLETQLRNPQNSSSLRFSSENTLKIQKKLAKLGLYTGSLDGIEGPKTRRAIALWKKQNANKIKNISLSKDTTDKIAVLIQQSEIEPANEGKKSKDLSDTQTIISKPPTTEIEKVQHALRIFGNHEVNITGVEDQKTVDALKQFQKMFNLPVTGKINRTVLVKMHKIGLLD